MHTNEYIRTVKNAQAVCGILKDGAGYDAHIVGGALRVAALGGTTRDVDIAVIVSDVQEANALSNDLSILLRPLGMCFELQHCKIGYESLNGFLADWRCDAINIIAYDKAIVRDVQGLVGAFDLNINQWYLDEGGELRNHFYDPETKLVKVNPERDNDFQNFRLEDRVTRFKADYPHLDWSEVDAQRPFTGEG